MDWIELVKLYSCLFLCLGMAQQQQQKDVFQELKNNFNIAHWLFVMHQRALTVPMRKHYGVQALGFPCFFALILMVLWWVATHDNLMLLWIGFWLLCQIKRRVESLRLVKKGVRVHSHYDGWPFDAMKFVKSEKAAKMIVEPILIGILGFMAFKGYEHMGWRQTGLPYFLLAGVVTLPFVELVKQMAWDRRLQAMNDARIEQEMTVQEYRDKFGN